MSEHEEHTSHSQGFYIAIGIGLLVGTATTVGAAFVNLGPFNPIIALLIATIKATVVVLFFMHVKGSADRCCRPDKQADANGYVKSLRVTSVFFVFRHIEVLSSQFIQEKAAKTLGLVSGHHFSDAASPSKSNAPLGAAVHRTAAVRNAG